MEISTKCTYFQNLKADFFLKLKTQKTMMNTIRTILNTIDSISAVYTVDTNQIKSKNNLIF
jgi:hypothetical protein